MEFNMVNTYKYTLDSLSDTAGVDVKWLLSGMYNQQEVWLCALCRGTAGPRISRLVWAFADYLSDSF